MSLKIETGSRQSFENIFVSSLQTVKLTNGENINIYTQCGGYKEQLAQRSFNIFLKRVVVYTRRW